MSITYARTLGAQARPAGTSSGYPVPGPQSYTSEEIATAAFFASEAEWRALLAQPFDFIVIGTGQTGVAFCEQALRNDPHARILVLERGPFWLPEHYQNLPLAMRAATGSPPTTYPWTRSREMATGPDALFQAGMIPVLGGRSSYWSAWCPTPTPDLMRDWPQALIDVTLQPGFWERARRFLHVQTTDTIQNGVYGDLQTQIDARLTASVPSQIPTAQGASAAPIAVATPDWSTTSCHRYCTVGTLLGLAQAQADLAARGKGSPLPIVDRCVVTRLIHDGGVVTAIETSRGSIAVGDAKIILSMGAIPPATLLAYSFGPRLPNVGRRYTGHFMSHVTARVPRAAFCDLKPLEIAAAYVHGKDPSSQLQYHVQMSAFAESDPIQQQVTAFHNLPDAAAAPSLPQLIGSEGYVVFVCATLGEVAPNPKSWVRPNPAADPTATSRIQLHLGDADQRLWDTLDEATWQTIDAAAGGAPVEYWSDNASGWQTARPSAAEIRQTILVHEASMLWIGEDPEISVVGLDYRPHGVQNVYVTGGSLFPTSGSWNPTLTMCGFAQDLADRLTLPRANAA